MPTSRPARGSLHFMQTECRPRDQRAVRMGRGRTAGQDTEKEDTFGDRPLDAPTSA
jgi:hypothetical protein